jgi:arylsulfate sulfotransferase
MRTLNFAAFAVFAVFAMLLFPAMGNAQSNTCTISLTPSTPSPQLVGDRVVWTATAANCGNAPVYQYRVAITSEASEDDDDRFERSGNSGDRWRKHLQFRMVRDFSPGNTFVWSPQQEGPYQIMVRVKDSFDATDAISAVVPATANSRVTGTVAVVTPTLNPLVAMYSAPAREDGNMQVKFRPAAGTSDSLWMTTNKLPCVDGKSRNFLVAGMLANTSYEMVHVTSDGALSASLFFTTGAPPATLSFPRFTVRQAPGPESDDSQQMIYHNFAGRPAPNAVNQVATDLNGRIEWYYDPLESGLVNVGNPGILESGGTVLVLGRDRNRTLGFNVLREIDLAGNPLRETNIDAVNAQLKIKGQGIIYGFHHEMLRLPNGNIATHGWNLRTVDVNGTPTPYAGNLLVVLDTNFQVVWTWDAFDHLDVHRGPILGDVCTGQPCPIVGAVDWLHANGIARSPEDGELLISVRHQDWVIKIDYDHGSGDGHIIWRLGKDGDFAINSTEPNPWFSYQHNVHYIDEKTLLLFDNGNSRCFGVNNCHSRGQIWTIDEKNMTASPVLNVDLGNFSDSQGSAETLPNGNFVFTSGSQGPPAAIFGQSIEVLPDGTKVYVLEAGAREYRSYRMRGLYRGIRR